MVTRIKDVQGVRLAGRVAALRQRMATWRGGQVDALLVSNPRDIRYLTGFAGDDSWLLVARRGEGYRGLVILSDFRFQEEIAREAPRVRAVMRKAALSDELLKLRGPLKLKKIALQMEYLTLAQRKALAKKLGAARLVDVDDGLLAQRAIKDHGEIAAIRRALAIHQEAMLDTLRQLKPGKTENEVAAYLGYRMRVLGAQGTSFPTIVAFGANGSLPHAVPGPRKLKAGDAILIDCGARFDGYCSDLTRVYALGSMPAKVRQIFRVVLEAQLAAIEAIAPGKPLKEIDAVARRIIKRAGYGKRFGHGLGHGIGLNIHEQPVLSGRSQGTLEPGHVVTVEPGIYLPGVGGVRIEDDVLVTPTGHSVLSDLPKNLESAII